METSLMFSLSKSAYDFLELPVSFNNQKEKEKKKENRRKKLRKQIQNDEAGTRKDERLN